MTFAVTDHAVERYLQHRGALDPRPEIAGRVRAAWEAARVSEGERGAVNVRDLERPDLVFACLLDRPRDELVVVTLWEAGEEPWSPGGSPMRWGDASELRPCRRREPPDSPPLPARSSPDSPRTPNLGH